MHLTPSEKFQGHKIVITTRLVTVDESKPWTAENYIDVAVPEHHTFDVDKNVGRHAIVRAALAAIAELKRK